MVLKGCCNSLPKLVIILLGTGGEPDTAGKRKVESIVWADKMP